MATAGVCEAAANMFWLDAQKVGLRLLCRLNHQLGQLYTAYERLLGKRGGALAGVPPDTATRARFYFPAPISALVLDTVLLPQECFNALVLAWHLAMFLARKQHEHEWRWRRWGCGLAASAQVRQVDQTDPRTALLHVLNFRKPAKPHRWHTQTPPICSQMLAFAKLEIKRRCRGQTAAEHTKHPEGVGTRFKGCPWVTN